MIKYSFEYNIDRFEYSIDIFNFVIDIVKFNPNLPEDIEYDIYEFWEDDAGRRHIQLVPPSHFLYSHEGIYEKAIDCAFRNIYEKENDYDNFRN